MVFFIDEARSRPPHPALLTNVNKKMVFFIEGFPYHILPSVFKIVSLSIYQRLNPAVLGHRHILTI